MVATSQGLIPDELAQEIFQEIFKAHSAVVSLTFALTCAKLAVKTAKDELEAAQGELDALISDAKSGQKRLSTPPSEEESNG